MMEQVEQKNLVQYIIGVAITAAFTGCLFYGTVALDFPSGLAWFLIAVFLAFLVAIHKKRKYIAIGMVFGVFIVVFAIGYFIISYMVDPPTW